MAREVKIAQWKLLFFQARLVRCGSIGWSGGNSNFTNLEVKQNKSGMNGHMTQDPPHTL